MWSESEPSEARAGSPRVLIAHDFAETYGGAERIVAEIASAFPDAPVYAILGRRAVARRMGVADRFHSILPPRQRLLRHYRWLAPLYPALVSTRELPVADVLITSSYAFALGFRTANRAPSLCYCYSPFRLAWSMTTDYATRFGAGGLGEVGLRALAALLRQADLRAAGRVDRFVAESDQVRMQIQAYYRREAELIFPPVDCSVFRPDPAAEVADYVLFCGRLVEPYKRPTAVVEAFARLPGRRLIVAGDGPELGRLRSIAPPNVEFRGQVEDEELVSLMQRASFAVFPSKDDFGLIPVEVMACGRPVLAYSGGGALETVLAGITGEFFTDPAPEAIADAIERFDPDGYDPARICAHAQRFDRSIFAERITDQVLRLAKGRR